MQSGVREATNWSLEGMLGEHVGEFEGTATKEILCFAHGQCFLCPISEMLSNV